VPIWVIAEILGVSPDDLGLPPLVGRGDLGRGAEV
jgi:hypothetical protein